MTETTLFVIVGVIAVVAAVMMLLSQNAVYSALYLIVVMASIAFLFLLLEAPFLAMIQITVYAGAIMVLFIFVIMLLGAERTGVGRNKFRWLTPAALVLSALFLLIAGVAISRGGVDLQSPAAALPQVRVVNLAAGHEPITLFVRDQVVAEDLEYGAVSNFTAVQPGEAGIGYATADGQGFNTQFELEPGASQTLVAYSQDGTLALNLVPTDTSTVPDDNARVTFANTYDALPSVDIVDLGANGELDFDLTGVMTDRVLIDDLEPGEITEPRDVEEGDVFWGVIAPNGDLIARVLGGDVGRSYAVEAGQAELVVIAGRFSLVDNTIRPAVAVFRDEAAPAFGGPEAIGIDLFTRYLLPFEMVSLLLLAAMVGAIVLTHKEEARVHLRDRSTRRRVSRPLASVISAQVGHEVTEASVEERPALPPAEGQAPAGD